MPKRKIRRNSDFLQFRPFRAFTAPADQDKSGWPKIVWRIVLVAVFVSAVIAGVVLFLH